MAKDVVIIQQTTQTQQERKRVAAYARVSCGKDTMLHSLAAQIDYYRKLILNNPTWWLYEATPDQCIVISDEIWSDILLNGHKHIPTQSISEDAKNRTIAVYAPSKTFNLAGLIGSYHIIYNDYLKDRMRNQSDMSHYNSMNVLSMHALIGAYKPEGHQNIMTTTISKRIWKRNGC